MIGTFGILFKKILAYPNIIKIFPSVHFYKFNCFRS